MSGRFKNEYQRGMRKTVSRAFVMVLIVFCLCLKPITVLAAGEDGGASGAGTDSGSGGAQSPGQGGAGQDASPGDGRLVVKIDTVKFTGKSGNVLVSCESGKPDAYYILVEKAGGSKPTAKEIRSKGTKSVDGYLSMPPVTKDVEYVVYAVAEDAAGRLSEVSSRRAASSASRGIQILGHVYCTLQARDEIDDQTNTPGEITINAGTDGSVRKIEYLIADRFVNTDAMIETIATEDKDVTTLTGTTSVPLSKWTEYNAKEKPGLMRNRLNYVYVRMLDEDENYTYLSSRGIWEDETLPLAQSVSGKAEETTAVVTVTGEDEESGVKRYYLIYRDPVDLSPVEPKDVKLRGLSSEDGIFKLSGLSKRTRYDLYAVVEDRAGNLSQVRDGTMTTEGEVEASAVRPSSDASDPGGSSNIAQVTEGITLEDPEVSSSSSERAPFLVASGDKEYAGLMKISGWDSIRTVAEKTAEPADLYVDMNGGATVPGDVLEKIMGRNISFHFIMEDNLTWVINGLGFTSKPLSTDFRITRDATRIPIRQINDLAGVSPHQEFTVQHDGAFTFQAVLNMGLGSGNVGKEAHLYRYDVGANTLEHLQTESINDQGLVSFSIPGESDYVVLIGAVSGAEQEETPAETGRVTDDSYKDFINEDKKSGNLWIILVSVIAILLCGVILFLPRDKSDGKDSIDE